ncbi:MAG: enoyl-CoA hydratase/isomerase family protein [Proteobacteria bacterium]|nr:enoyl-CoA hydratase/isomerase family protein [Pseudomonadota bacterium]
MSYETIVYENEGPVGIIRLNRPERMNAVVEEMYRDLQDVLRQAQEDTATRILVLTGSSFKKGDTLKQAFCAGADLKKHGTSERTFEDKKAYIELAHETCRKLYDFPKPVIASINGPARGAGVEMAFCCDFIFMAENATLAFPEIGLGTCVGGGVTSHLPRMVGLTTAKELIFTGRVIDGRSALEMGLALKCFPLENLLSETLAFAREVADKAPVSVKLVKAMLNDTSPRDIHGVLSAETDAILKCMKTDDWHEGVRSFSEKRKPVYKGR